MRGCSIAAALLPFLPIVVPSLHRRLVSPLAATMPINNYGRVCSRVSLQQYFHITSQINPLIKASSQHPSPLTRVVRP